MQSGTQAVSSRYLRNFPPHCWQILGVIVRCCHRAHLTPSCLCWGCFARETCRCLLFRQYDGKPPHPSIGAHLHHVYPAGNAFGSK